MKALYAVLSQLSFMLCGGQIRIFLYNPGKKSTFCRYSQL